MKATQKLHVTVEDLEFETTFDKLDAKIKNFAVKLWESGEHSYCKLYVNNAGAQLCVMVRYVGPVPKNAGKRKLFGYDEQEFLAKQY